MSTEAGFGGGHKSSSTYGVITSLPGGTFTALLAEPPSPAHSVGKGEENLEGGAAQDSLAIEAAKRLQHTSNDEILAGKATLSEATAVIAPRPQRLDISQDDIAPAEESEGEDNDGYCYADAGLRDENGTILKQRVPDEHNQEAETGPPGSSSSSSSSSHIDIVKPRQSQTTSKPKSVPKQKPLVECIEVVEEIEEEVEDEGDEDEDESLEKPRRKQLIPRELLISELISYIKDSGPAGKPLVEKEFIDAVTAKAALHVVVAAAMDYVRAIPLGLSQSLPIAETLLTTCIPDSLAVSTKPHLASQEMIDAVVQALKAFETDESKSIESSKASSSSSSSSSFSSSSTLPNSETQLRGTLPLFARGEHTTIVPPPQYEVAKNMLVGNEKKTPEGKGSLLHFCVYSVNVPCAQLLLALGASVEAEGVIVGRSKNGGDNLMGRLEGTALEMVKKMPDTFTSKGTTKKLMFRVSQAGALKSLLVDAEAEAEAKGNSALPVFEPFPFAPLPPEALVPRPPKVKKMKKIIRKVTRIVTVEKAPGAPAMGVKKRPQKENDKEGESPSKRPKPSASSSIQIPLQTVPVPQVPALPPGPFSALSPEFLAVQSAVVLLFKERGKEEVRIASDALPFVTAALSTTQFAEESKDPTWVEKGLQALDRENKVYIENDQLHRI